MKRQINLYGAEFRPKRQWASLNQMALVWGGWLVRGTSRASAMRP